MKASRVHLTLLACLIGMRPALVLCGSELSVTGWSLGGSVRPSLASLLNLGYGVGLILVCPLPPCDPEPVPLSWIKACVRIRRIKCSDNRMQLIGRDAIM
jgi:hypothetical protein